MESLYQVSYEESMMEEIFLAELEWEREQPEER